MNGSEASPSRASPTCRRRFVWLTLVMLLASTGPALAHKVHVFAIAEGATIEGSAYFSGGAPASGASVRVFGSEGTLLARMDTNAEGRFQYQAERRQALRFVVQTTDGHQGEFTIFADELPASLAKRADRPGPGSLGTGSDVGAVSGTDGTVAETRPAPARADAAGEIATETGALALTPAMETQLRQMIAHELAPLRTALDRYETRVRVADVLAGVGFMFGLFGVAMLVAARRPRS